MTGRAGAWIAVALSSVTWLGAVALSGLAIDMPLGPEGPAATPAVAPQAPASPPNGPTERKAKEKIVEIAPWEEVPA